MVYIDKRALLDICLREDTTLLRLHEYLFPHRHPLPAAPFHVRLLRDWYTSTEKIVQTVFRGGAKTTLGEEATTILAASGLENNIPIIGSSEKRAKERLEAIKHELTNNERLQTMFGPLGEGSAQIWQADKVVLANNVCIQALGWNQSMRGLKHLEHRPGFCWIDDIEDEENSATPEARRKVTRRLLAVVIPAVDAPGARLRVTGTIIDPESLVVQLAKLPGWKSRVYPVRFISPSSGQWIASWPERRSASQIEAMEKEYIAAGEKDIFDREYMCQSIADESRTFRKSEFRAQVIRRSYEATYIVYDPARTVNESSAYTGKIVASWQGARILIWESSAFHWRPDEILDDMFKMDEKYNPILIGVEKDGLDEFILQPLRSEQMKRGHILPIHPLRAPKGKLSFIRGLQPFFNAGEIIFVPDLAYHQQLVDQLSSFPTGKIDTLNALAYMIRLRPGVPIFDSFDPSLHIDKVFTPSSKYPTTLAIHSDGAHTVGVLTQLSRSVHHVIADWVLEGSPLQTLPDIISYAAQASPSRLVSALAPRLHWSHYDTIGLRAAASRALLPTSQAGDLAKALTFLAGALSRLAHGSPSLLVSPAATWTLRAFSGGYARPAGSSVPVPGPYQLIIEALACSVAQSELQVDSEEGRRYDTTRSGTPYLSARR